MTKTLTSLSRVLISASLGIAVLLATVLLQRENENVKEKHPHHFSSRLI